MNVHDLSYSVARALLESSSKSSLEHGVKQAPFTITISREVGALGNTVAKEVGRRLGWPAYDREILDRIAEEVKQPTFYFEGLDERPANWFDTVLAGLANDYRVTPSAYMKYLAGVVRGLGKIGNCVIVGRGANFLLPAATTLRVRLVADEADRIDVIRKRQNLPAKEAARWVTQTERDREGFIKNHLGFNATDPHHYDLVLNTSRLSVAECGRLIVETLRTFEERAARKAQAPMREPELAGSST